MSQNNKDYQLILTNLHWNKKKTTKKRYMKKAVQIENM